MKFTKIIVILLCLTSAVFTANISAKESLTDETKVEVYVVTKENLTAFIDGSAENGDVTYYIDGIEVKSEFSSIWDFIQSLNSKVNSNYGLASQAYTIADNAYARTTENRENIGNMGNTLDQHAYTLGIHYDAINDTYGKLYLLKDEVVAFEDHYFEFENNTNNTLNFQENRIDTLRAQLDDLNGFVALIKNSLIGLTIVAMGIYLVNRKYPLKEVLQNKKPVLAKSKQQKIQEFTKIKSKSFRYKITHIRINKDKSPLKFLFSFFVIKK